MTTLQSSLKGVCFHVEHGLSQVSLTASSCHSITARGMRSGTCHVQSCEIYVADAVIHAQAMI